MGGLGGFLRDAGAFPRLFFHINMVKPKVNAFCYTKRKSWCVLFSYHAAYAAHICICTSCINVYACHSLLHIPYLSIHATSTAPNAASPRRLCQPPWTRTICRKPPLTCRRNQASSTAPAKRQPLFGRGGLGERCFSQRSSLSPSVPLCITLLNLLFSQSCPHVEKSGDFGFSTGRYSQGVERVKSGD